MTVILYRGLPGSGKTTAAEKVSRWHCENDSYHLKDGKYCWDPTRVKDAAMACYRNFCLGLCVDRKGTITVANTFTQRWEIQPYIMQGLAMNHEVQIVNMHADFLSKEEIIKFHERNVHNVPLSSMHVMYKRWESSEGWL